jgi:hypothetical protein
MYKIITIMLLTLSSKASSNQLNNHDELTDTLEKIRLLNDIPAMAVAIISKGEITYFNGFGYLDEIKLKPTIKGSLF